MYIHRISVLRAQTAECERGERQQLLNSSPVRWQVSRLPGGGGGRVRGGGGGGADVTDELGLLQLFVRIEEIYTIKQRNVAPLWRTN